MRYYLIAGERSGDLHGSNLIKSLKKKDPQAEFRAWGGEYMENAGANLVVHYDNLGFMGFMEVLIYFRKILKYIKLCKKDIISYQPDVVILIDFAGFNMRIAQFLKKKGVLVYYYISPKIWAWNTGRARKIKKSIDRMFVILPFEKAFYHQYNYDVDYVGNPVVDAIDSHTPDPSFLKGIGLLKDEKYVALLPGSRKQELESILPEMVKLARSMPDVIFILGAIHGVNDSYYATSTSVQNIKLVFDRTYDVLAYAHAAVVTSGTATLETCLWKVPQVVVYKSNSRISMAIAKMVIKVKFISLVNLIAGKEVVKELIQENLSPENLNDEVVKLYKNNQYRNQILDSYEEISSILGKDPVSDKAATMIVKYLNG